MPNAWTRALRTHRPITATLAPAAANPLHISLPSTPTGSCLSRRVSSSTEGGRWCGRTSPAGHDRNLRGGMHCVRCTVAPTVPPGGRVDATDLCCAPMALKNLDGRAVR